MPEDPVSRHERGREGNVIFPRWNQHPKLLYLNYGPQSGVIASLSAWLRRLGVDVRCRAPIRQFLYSCRLGGLPVPNLRPDVTRAVYHAIRTHGRAWKDYYFHTRYAWDRMSELAQTVIDRERPDVVLQ